MREEYIGLVTIWIGHNLKYFLNMVK